MADSIPLKALFNPDGSVKTLAEFAVTDTVAIANGGTGTDALGTVLGGAGINIIDGVSAVVKSFSVSIDSNTLSILGGNITGTIDGGSYQ